MSISFYLALAMIFCSNCTSSISSQHPAEPSTEIITKDGLRLLESKVQQSVSGYNGKRTTEYFFKINVATSEPIIFDSVFIGSTRYTSFISKESNTITNEPVIVHTGDTVIVRVSKLLPAAKSLVLQDYAGEARILYLINGKRNSMIVRQIKEIPTANTQ